MNTEDLTTTQISILTLLRARDKNGDVNTPIPGRIHLIKELFAVHSTNLGKQLLNELHFEPDNYGPFDETIFAALDDLHNAKLIKFVTTDKYSKIQLTSEGEQLAKVIWQRIHPEVQDLFSYVKINYNHKSSQAVLEEIYSAFPHMTKNSISRIAEKYRIMGI